MPALTEDQVLQVIRDLFKSYPSIDKAAESIGVSRQHYYDVVGTRGRHPGPKLLKAIGYRRVAKYAYEPILEK